MRWDDGNSISLLLSSCLGTRGRPKLLSSVVSSSSGRLLSLLKRSTHPLTRVVLKAARTQLSRHGDGGLTCALLALQLTSPRLPLAIVTTTVGSLYDQFAQEFLHILQTEVSVDVDFGCVRDLRCVVRTLLSSKPGCCLPPRDADVICSLLLQSFLDAVPSGTVGVVGVLGLAPAHSRLVEGVMLPISVEDEERIRRGLVGDGPFRACLFARSLAGEMDWPAHFLSTTQDTEEASLRHLSSVVDRATEGGVSLFLCQKVLHPRLRKRMLAKGMLVLDRLGGENAAQLRSMWDEGESCGDVWFGSVSRLRVERVGRRSRFLVLSSPGDPCSVLLTHHNQESLAELEVVCRQSLSALFRLLGPRPRVCYGGGCSEITAALVLSKKVRDGLDSICVETGCSPEHVMCSLESFVLGVVHLCSSIHQGAPIDFATDVEGGHLWQQRPPADRCACGIRDASSVKSSAWRQLTDIAGLADILLTSVPRQVNPPSIPSVSEDVNPLRPPSDSTSSPLAPCASLVDGHPYLTQSTFVSCPVPQTPRLVPQNALAPQLSVSLAKNPSSAGRDISLDEIGCELRNLSLPVSPEQNVRKAASAGRDILLDELGCKLSCLSLAFETSIMLLKTTECIHTSPRPTLEETKGEG